MGDLEDQRDLRERLIRLEEKLTSLDDRLKVIEARSGAQDAKVFGVMSAIVAYVGSQLLGLLGGGAP